LHFMLLHFMLLHFMLLHFMRRFRFWQANAL